MLRIHFNLAWPSNRYGNGSSSKNLIIQSDRLANHRYDYNFEKVEYFLKFETTFEVYSLYIKRNLL